MKKQHDSNIILLSQQSAVHKFTNNKQHNKIKKNLHNKV